MTQQPSDDHSSRVPAPGRRRPPRLLPRLAAVAASLVVLAPLAAPVATAGPTPGLDPGASLAGGAVVGSETTPVAQNPVSVELVEMNPTTARNGDTVTVRVRLTNTTADTISGARASLHAHWEALDDREVLDEWVHAPLYDSSADRRMGTRWGSVDVPDLAPGASTEVSFTYTTNGDFQGWGARRLAVVVNDVVRVGILRSFLVYDAQDEFSPAATSPVTLSVALPVTGPAVSADDPESQELELARLVADGNRLDSLLEVARTGQVSLALDPQVVAAAATSTDETLTTWAQEMVAAAGATTTFTLPSYDPDPAALAHSGIGAEPVRSFQTAPVADGWEVPAGWVQDLTWPADTAQTDAATLRSAVATGRGRVIVGQGTLAPVSGTSTPSALAEVPLETGVASVVVSDAALSEAFLDATDTAWSLAGTSAAGDAAAADAAATEPVTEVPTTQARQWLLAEVAAIVASDPTAAPHVVIALPRTWTPDLAAYQSVTDAITGSGMVRLAPLGDLFAQPASAAEREPLAEVVGTETELSTAAVTELERSRSAIASFATVAGESSAPVAASAMPHLTSPLAVAYRSNPQSRDAAVQNGLAFVHTTTSSVGVTSRTSINLLTEDAALPVRVYNDLEVPVTVTVVLRPDSLGLRVLARPTQTIPAQSFADVQVPVSAVGSGSVDVGVQLLTPTAAPTQIGADTSFEVRIQAQWEEIGTLVAAAGIGVLFVAGIWRTVRRGRSPNRATREDVEAATGEIASAAASAESSGSSEGQHDAEHARPAHARQPK